VIDNLESLQIVLDELVIWLESQDLIINVKKTKYMIFSKPNDRTPPDSVALYCNTEDVERVDCFKYLGVMVDEHLNFKKHFQSVKNRVSGAIGSILRMRRLLNTRMFSILLNTYVYSVIDYCLPIYGVDVTLLNNLQGKIDRLLQMFFQKLPKKRKKYYISQPDPIKENDLFAWYETCNIISCAERLEYYTLTYLFNILRVSDVLTLKDSFVIKDRSRSTKFENTIEVRSHKSATFAKSLAYRATKLWNELPAFLREPKCGLNSFKYVVSQILINRRCEP
jgi:hypothetical protein